MSDPTVDGAPPVRVSRRGSLALLTLNRPAERNPLDQQTSRELLRAFTAAEMEKTLEKVV